MLAALLLGSPSHAIPLRVAPDMVPIAASAVRELWPEGAIEVLPAPSPDGELGLLWDGTEIVWISTGGTHVESASDLATAILLARTWLREMPDRDIGWIPAVGVEPPDGMLPLVAPTRPLPRLCGALGIGGQGSPARGRPLDGFRITAAAMLPHTEYGVSVFIARSSAPALTRAERILDDQPGQVISTEFETLIATAYASWDIGAGRPAKIFAEPRLLGGFELRDSYTRTLIAGNTIDRYDNSDSYVDVGPVFALGIDLWIDSICLRTLAGERIGWFSPNRGWTYQNFLAVDLVFQIPTLR